MARASGCIPFGKLFDTARTFRSSFVWKKLGSHTYVIARICEGRLHVYVYIFFVWVCFTCMGRLFPKKQYQLYHSHTEFRTPRQSMSRHHQTMTSAASPCVTSLLNTIYAITIIAYIFFFKYRNCTHKNHSNYIPWIHIISGN